MSSPENLVDPRPTEEARREIGQWPADDAYAALMEAIQKRIDAADDPDERSRLTKLRDDAASIGKTVLTGVIAEAARRIVF